MTPFQIVLGILAMMAVTAILYIWGLRKSDRRQEDMGRHLLSACGARVVKYLKKHDTVSADEVAGLISGMKTGEFWSRQKLQVKDGTQFSGEVIRFLLDQLYIEKAGENSYRLRK